MTRFRLWLARVVLRELPYVVVSQEMFEDYCAILAAQRDFYRLLELNPHLKVTETLLSRAPERFQ